MCIKLTVIYLFKLFIFRLATLFGGGVGGCSRLLTNYEKIQNTVIKSYWPKINGTSLSPPPLTTSRTRQQIISKGRWYSHQDADEYGEIYYAEYQMYKNRTIQRERARALRNEHPTMQLAIPLIVL